MAVVNTVPGLLAARAAAEPDHVALMVDGGPALTIAEWHERAQRAARALVARGVRPGDRVGLVFGGVDWADYAVAFVAVTAAGAAAVPVSASLPGARAAELFADCGASVVLGPSDLESGVDGELPVVAPADLAQVIYTSGTTGAAKGVFASHANLTHGLGRLAHSRHVVHAFPLGTNAAQTMLVASLAARPTFVVAPAFEPAGFAALVRQHAATSIFVVPAMVTALLPYAGQLASVELVASSAAPLPPAVALRLCRALPDVTIINSYTSTEAAPAFVSTVFDPRRPTAVGRSADVRVDAAGQVWLRSPHARGYLGEEPFAHGWVRTGDVGYLDADGYLHLLDRASDVVKVAGHRVSTIRVENALHEHPAVMDATVIGLPHPTMGTMLTASVVVAGEAGDLRAFLAERLAPHEIPVRIDLADALPRNEMGKVLKGRLAALASACQSVLGVADVGPGDNFFALGGDSLTASRLADRTGIPLEAVFAAPTLADLAVHMAPSEPDTARVDERLALTATQESMLAWMYETDPPRDAGPVSVGIRIRDTFDVALLERALEVVIARHEPLRTVFRERQPVLLDRLAPAVTLVDTPQEVLADREGRFDLAHGPVVRAAIARLGPSDHVLVLAVHHLVFDGASMGMLLHELGTVYSALRTGSPVVLKPLPLSYPAHVAWTRAQWEQTIPYWTRALAGAPSHLDFPARRHATRIRHASLRFDLGPAAPVHERARAHGATAFMVIAAAWAATLARFSGSDDIVLLVPLQGRTRPGTEHLIGCLVQSVLLRIDASDRAGLLARVKRATLEALEHQFHPFARFFAQHGGASFLRVEHWAGPAHFPGLESEPYELPRELEADWPTPGGAPDRQAPELAVVEQRDGTLSAWLLYNQHAFDRSTMNEMAQELRKVNDMSEGLPRANRWPIVPKRSGGTR